MAMPGYDQPEWQVAQDRLKRKRAVAEAMLQRGMTPLPQQDAPISWTQGLAQIANAYLGARGLKNADNEGYAMAQRYNQALGDEVQRVAKIRQGEPVPVDPQELEQAADQGTPKPRTSTGDPQAAIRAALLSQFAPVREMGKLDFQADLKEREGAAARLARLEDRKMQIEAMSYERALDRTAKEALQKQHDAVLKEIAEIKKSAGQERSPFFTPVYTPQGVLSFDNRAGTLAQPLLNGQPVVRSTDDPRLQGDIAGAKAHGKATAERQFNMEGIGGVIKRAEDVLSGRDPSDPTKKRPLPTQSGAGTIVDKVGGFFGMSPDGAVEAQDLKAIAGALTAKMPRMEGPQSDRDVQLYRESAAEVGDSSVPVDRRLRALETVKMLWQKYEKFNPEAFARSPTAPPGGPPNVRVVDW